MNEVMTAYGQLYADLDMTPDEIMEEMLCDVAGVFIV